ncbi:MAG: translation initiation factor IF-2 N-terminal domain-containing protein [Evtepia sp.]
MSFEKYRVHEVAKDFGKQTKEITQILTKYATTPKNHMQVLEDGELSIVFEYLTQHNQVADLQTALDTPAPAKNEGKGSRGREGKGPAPRTSPRSAPTRAAATRGKAATVPKGMPTAARPQGEQARPAAQAAAPVVAPAPPPGPRRSWWTPGR